MDFEDIKHDNAIEIKVKGRMDAVAAPEFESHCDEWLNKGERMFVVDMGGLEYVSSAGLRSILATAKKLKASQGAIHFCNLSGMVQEVFTVSGFSTMFQIHDTAEQALEQI